MASADQTSSSAKEHLLNHFRIRDLYDITNAIYSPFDNSDIAVNHVPQTRPTDQRHWDIVTTHSPPGLEAIFSADFSSQRGQADHCLIQVLNEMSEPPPSVSVHAPEDLSDASLPLALINSISQTPLTLLTLDNQKLQCSIRL